MQGVWFRDSCRTKAEALGVHGWVRNLPDGRVEVVLEGALDAVDQMTDWCRHGPPHATVAAVVATQEAPVGETTFRII